MKLLFDLESNGLLDTVSKVHCIVIQNVETDEILSFVGHDEIIAKAIPMLNEAEELSGHNIIGYDIPALRKIFPGKLKEDINAFDTLLAVKLSNPDIYQMDVAKRYPKLSQKNYGSYSLESWGERLGNHKASKPVDFEEFTEDMLKYCIQDVSTNVTIYKYLKGLNLSERALQLETDFWFNTIDMSDSGFPFDLKAAQAMYARLSAEREEIRQELITLFPTRTIERVSEKTGKPLKPTVIEFNPGSRDHIAYWFKKKYDWQPKAFTPSGKPEINADVLEELDYPEAKELKRYFVIDKIIGMVGEGKNAWLTMVGNDGRMHGRINTIGAATTRCSHSTPNMAQVPGARKEFGLECRALFHAPKGYKQIGTDLNAIELRCFAHYLGAYDNGEYTNIILGGDIHWANAVAAGFHSPLPEGQVYDSSVKAQKLARDQAKTLIYAMIYGAGDAKLGMIVGGATKEGKAIRKKFYENFPAIEKFTNDVKKAAEGRGNIKLLHGATIPVRKAFAALNTLLQGAGAVVAKEWLNVAREMAESKGWKYNEDFWFAGHIHDEIQAIAKDGIAEDFAKLMEASAQEAGNRLGMRCRVDAEAKVGQNWADCH
jgi:DNA polymerase I-like protein with 3'-5' exonuclease and polymerase domains